MTRRRPNPYAVVALGVLLGAAIGLPVGAVATWLVQR